MWKKILSLLLLFLTLGFDLDSKAWVYDLFVAGFSIFLKNFKFSLTSLFNLAGIGSSMTNTNDGLATSLPLFTRGWMFLTWGENLDLTLLLKVVFLLSIYRESQWELYTMEINFQMALPMLFRSLISLALSPLIDLLAMNFRILVSDSLILRISEARCFIEPCNETI